MRDYRSVLILLSLGLLAFGSAQETSPEEEEITDLFVRVVESWGQRPRVLITSKSFADDLHLVDPRGRTLKGVDKIRQAYEQLLRQGLVQGSELIVDLEETRFQQEGAASVDGAWEVSWPYSQGRIPKLRGRFSVDLRRDAQTWKFQAARVTRSR